MNLGERYRNEPPVISLEVFPPKDGTSESVIRIVSELAPLKPTFVSVTCSAGGSGSDNTLPIALELKQALGIETVVHVTCANHSRTELEGHLRQVAASGVANIIALRGDPPKGSDRFVTHEGGYSFAIDLVRHIQQLNADGLGSGSAVSQFTVGVAGYPEAHPEAPDLATDLQHLKAKVDAGADFVATQMFFDAPLCIDFVRQARALGITVPIVPGILPVERYPQVMRLLDQMGIGIPDAFRDALEANRDDPDAIREICHQHTLTMCTQLLSAGAPGLHFYTLNKSHATARILRDLFPAT